jgi:hypothetical protein
MDEQTPSAPIACGLYLRCDGTLMLAGAEKAIEIRLQPAQLLLLASNAMNVALALDPTLQTDIDETINVWQRALQPEGVCSIN